MKRGWIGTRNLTYRLPFLITPWTARMCRQEKKTWHLIRTNDNLFHTVDLLIKYFNVTEKWPHLYFHTRRYRSMRVLGMIVWLSEGRPNFHVGLIEIHKPSGILNVDLPSCILFCLLVCLGVLFFTSRVSLLFSALHSVPHFPISSTSMEQLYSS